MGRTVVVVGHGMVGHRFVEALRERDNDSAWRIVVLGEEPRPAYDRVSLSMSLYGLDADDLCLVDAATREDPAVDLRTATAVSRIDRSGRRIWTRCGQVFDYDALVLATGSRAFVPPVEGSDLDGCFVYRTPEDLAAIRVASECASSGVVVGGGLLGLETAAVLRMLGLRVHVVERAPWLMPVQLDEGGGRLLARLVSQLGVEVSCGADVEALGSAGGRVSSVHLASGGSLPAELVVFAAGVRPRDELARRAELSVGERGGVLVDSACRTADPRIWAIGECAAVEGRCYGLVEPGYDMAECVADQLIGDYSTVDCPDTSAKMKLLGVEVASFGELPGDADSTVDARELALDGPESSAYGKLVERDGVLVGGVLVGDTSAYGRLRSLVGQQLPADPESLLASGNPGAGKRVQR